MGVRFSTFISVLNLLAARILNVAIPCYGSQVFYISHWSRLLMFPDFCRSNPMLWESGFLREARRNESGGVGEITYSVAIPCYGSQVFYTKIVGAILLWLMGSSNPMLWESGFLLFPYFLFQSIFRAPL